jgi:hypothetical protein
LIAAQFTATKGRDRRELEVCRAWATSSLPVPLSPLAKHPIFTLEPVALERSGDDDPKLIIIKRLWNVVIGPALHGFDRNLLASVRRDHDDGGLGPLFLRDPKHIHPAGSPTEGQICDH